MRRGTLPAFAAVVIAAFALPANAGATWPGANGRIAYVRTWVGVGHEARDLRLRVMDPDGRGKRDLTGGAFDPAFSADGRRIAFACFSDWNGPRHICVIDVNGKNKRQITSAREGSDSRPVFSADGHKIAFLRELGEQSVPYEIDPAGGRARRISVAAWAGYRTGLPSSSPDGARAVFTDFRSGFEGGALYTASREGGDRQFVPNSPWDALLPAWSPDGRQVVFSRWFEPPDAGSFDNSRADVYVMNLDGTGLRALTHTRQGWTAEDVAWGPRP